MKNFYRAIFNIYIICSNTADAATTQIKIDDVVVKSDTAPEQKQSNNGAITSDQ